MTLCSYGISRSASKSDELHDFCINHVFPFKVAVYRNEMILIRKWKSECIVFPSSTMPDPHFNDSYASGQLLHYSSEPANVKPPTPEQQVWAISLRHAMHLNPSAPAQRSDDTPRRLPRDKFNLIKNIGPSQYFDLVVEAVKLYPQGGEIYVTDYTENNLLYHYNHPDENLDIDDSRDGDAFNYTGSVRRNEWPGPFGQMTLQVKLWEPHASHGFNKVKEGDSIELKNVHVKMDSSGARIEGAIHEDRQFPSRVGVSKIPPYDKRVRELEGRKQSYLARVKTQEQRAQGKATRRKRKEKKAADKRGKQGVALLDDHMSESDHSGANAHGKARERSW